MPKLVNIYRLIGYIFLANKNCCKTGQFVAKPNRRPYNLPCLTLLRSSYSYRNDSIGSFSEARFAGE